MARTSSRPTTAKTSDTSRRTGRAPVTIRDVAERAGVHVSTVSRVLSEDKRGLVNDKTAQRIDTIVAELGYAPNRLAQGLKTKRSKTVGALINDLTNPVFPALVRGIEDRLLESGYSVLVFNTDDDPARERRGYDTLNARQVDGFIMSTARREHALADHALDAGVPLALVVRNIDSHRAAAATPNERLAVRLGVEHLHSLGHTRIAHLAGPQEVSNGALRLAGVREAMTNLGLLIDPALIVDAAGFTIDQGERATRVLLDCGAPFTAIFAANDMLAVGALRVLSERGLRCPEDVSVLGFNDMPFADCLSPPLTTLHVPYYRLGVHVAELLLEQLAGLPAREISVDPQLVVRGSTAPRAG